MRETRVNRGEKDLHCPKPLISFVTENGSGSSSKHLGNRVWETKGAELLSALVLAFATFLASLLLSDEGASKAFEIALISLAVWLAIFALAHLSRAPWIVQRNTEEATKLPWWFGVLGMVVVLLMLAGTVAGGLRIHSMFESNIDLARVKFPSPSLKDAEIEKLEQTIRDIGLSPPRTVTRMLQAENRCWVANHRIVPSSAYKGAITGTEALIHCNYKIDAPFKIMVEFDRDFILPPGAVEFAERAGFNGYDQQKQGHTLVAQIGGPALLSDHFVVITVFGDTQEFPVAVSAGIAPSQ